MFWDEEEVWVLGPLLQLDDRDVLKLRLTVQRSRSGPSPPLKDVSIHDAILGERHICIPFIYCSAP